MKILYITQTLPYPLYNGSQIKTLFTLRNLLSKGHKVTLCSFVTKKQQLKYKSSLNRLSIETRLTLLNTNITSKESKINRVTLFIKSLFNSLPFMAYKNCNSLFKQGIIKILSENKYQMVWINELQMAQYLPDNFKGQSVLETQNVDSLLYKRMVIHEGSFKLKLFAFLEWIKFRIYERKMFPRFNKIYAISEFDKSQLDKITGRNDIEVIAPKVLNSRKRIPRRNSQIMLFIGSIWWYPNRDGILWFFNDIYPIIKQKIPKLKLWIIGDGPKNILDMKISGVTFFGFQKKLDKYYNKARLFIVPLRYGSGIRIKILEALKYDLPVISTPIGVEGLEKKLINEIFIENNEAAVANRIIDMLSNDQNLLFKRKRKL